MAEQSSQPGNDPKSAKPSLLAQAAKALSQLGLTFYVLLLVLALLATSGSDPRIAVLMALCAVVPLVFGPRAYRIIGLIALLIAGGLYLTAKPQPKRPFAAQKAPAAVASPPPAAAPGQPAR